MKEGIKRELIIQVTKYRIGLRVLSKCLRLKRKHVDGYQNPPKIENLLHIDPKSVKWISDIKFDKYVDMGKVVGGTWDQELISIMESPKISAVHLHFENDESWEETGVYDHMLNKIESRGEFDACSTIEDVKTRYEEIDSLYKSISENGYNVKMINHPLDHICVNIGRDGKFIFAGGGTHRLAIAQCLELESIPVRVIVRHEIWQEKNEPGSSYSTQTDNE